MPANTMMAQMEPRTSISAARPDAVRPNYLARVAITVALVVAGFTVFTTLGTTGDSSGEKNATNQSGAKRGDRPASDRAPAASDRSAGAVVDRPLRSFYKVKAGDSLGAIADKTGVPVTRLAELNPDVDPRALQPGRRLKLK